MSQSPVALPEPTPRRKGRPVLAWLVILAVVVFILWRHRAADPADRQAYDLVTAGFYGRYSVGMEQLERWLKKGEADVTVVYEQAQRNLDRHTYAQRLRFVVLAGELKGAQEAGEQLRRLDEDWHTHRGDPPEDDASTAQALRRLYAARADDPAADPLPEDTRSELRRRLGWFGDLALTPEEGSDPAARAAVLAPAWRTILSALVIFVVLFGAGALGLAFLVVLGVLWSLGRLRGGLRTGSAHGGIYAETFALYMLLFLGLGFAARYALRWLPLTHGTIALGGVVALASLAALVWPVLRGIPWQQVRDDIGWRAGRRPWLEGVCGIGCYGTALPLAFAGALLTLGMTALRDRLGLGPDEYGPSDSPGHPIALWVRQAPWWVWLEVVFVASFVAPLVEETMFRGVLYRHLREATSRLRPWLSVLASALAASFLFAVIHPQGFLGVPPLMALAIAFTLMREWRGTLLPPMIAHGVNNGVATLMLGLLMS